MAVSQTVLSSVENFLNGSNLGMWDSFMVFGDELTVTEKGVFKWLGNFEGLRNLVDGLELPPAKWITPAVGCKLYECKEVALRWYSSNGTLTLKGTKANEIKAKLLSFLENGQKMQTATSSCSRKFDCENLHINMNATSNSVGSKMDCRPTNDFLLNDVMFKIETVCAKVEDLADEVHNLKASRALYNREDSATPDPRREIQKLRVENDELRERNENLSYVIADLHAKVKEMKHEKCSLIAALKLFQLEQKQRRVDTDQVHNHKDIERPISKESSGEAVKPLTSTPLPSSSNVSKIVNKFEILSDKSENEKEAVSSKDLIEPTKDGGAKPEKPPRRSKVNHSKARNEEERKERNEKGGEAASTRNKNKLSAMIHRLDYRRQRLRSSANNKRKGIYVKANGETNTDETQQNIKPCRGKKRDEIFVNIESTNDPNNNYGEKEDEGDDLKEFLHLMI